MNCNRHSFQDTFACQHSRLSIMSSNVIGFQSSVLVFPLKRISLPYFFPRLDRMRSPMIDRVVRMSTFRCPLMFGRCSGERYRNRSHGSARRSLITGYLCMSSSIRSVIRASPTLADGNVAPIIKRQHQRPNMELNFPPTRVVFQAHPERPIK